MARRPNHPPTETLAPAELVRLRQSLEQMSEHELAAFYRATHNACRYVVRVPPPRMVQELVQSWRVLWNRRRN